MHENHIATILASLRSRETATASEIQQDTHWNRHIVDVAIAMLLNEGLIEQAGQKELILGWSEDAYKLSWREEESPPEKHGDGFMDMWTGSPLQDMWTGDGRDPLAPLPITAETKARDALAANPISYVLKEDA